MTSDSSPVDSAVPACCSRHPVARAVWHCTRCGKPLCSLCVSRFAETGATCLSCAGPCEAIRVPQSQAEEAEFVPSVLQAFRYPFLGDGIYLVVGGAVVFSLCDFLSTFSGALGIVLSLGVSGYIAAYAKELVSTSAMGKDVPPDWPDVTNWMEDLLAPALQFILVLALCFGPLSYLQFSRSHWHWSWYAGAASWASLTFPILCLAFGLADSALALLNPLPWVRAIIRALPQYLLTSFSCAAVLACSVLFVALLGKVGQIPIVPHLIGWVIQIYALATVMRIIGLFYRFNHHRFGW